MNTKGMIEAIVEAELDGMSLDDLCDYYAIAREGQLEQVSSDTVKRIYQELFLEPIEDDDSELGA